MTSPRAKLRQAAHYNFSLAREFRTARDDPKRSELSAELYRLATHYPLGQLVRRAGYAVARYHQKQKERYASKAALFDELRKHASSCLNCGNSWTLSKHNWAKLSCSNCESVLRVEHHNDTFEIDFRSPTRQVPQMPLFTGLEPQTSFEILTTPEYGAWAKFHLKWDEYSVGLTIKRLRAAIRKHKRKQFYNRPLPEWVEKFYQLNAAEKIQHATQLLFHELDKMLWEGHNADGQIVRACFGETPGMNGTKEFAKLNILLDRLDFSRMSTQCAMGVLSMAKPARQHLPIYSTLFNRAWGRLLVTAPDRIDRLLQGFV